MPESIGGAARGGTNVAISPGAGSQLFSSRALVFGNSSGQLTNNSSAPQWDTTANRLGIGTTAPNAVLHLQTTVNGNVFQVSGTTAGSSNLFVIESTGATSKIGFWGAAPATRAPAYTTAAITTARVFPTTAGISTFTGVSGAGAAFTSRADLEALVRVVDSMYQDLKALGLLQ